MTDEEVIAKDLGEKLGATFLRWDTEIFPPKKQTLEEYRAELRQTQLVAGGFGFGGESLLRAYARARIAAYEGVDNFTELPRRKPRQTADDYLNECNRIWNQGR